jgi:xylan 1,4-beta-xylosidase
VGGRRTYRNPVLSGFFPDPSVTRVGDYFYLANSSFQYFPAIPISRSRDLVNWEIIGHAVAESGFLDLSGIADSHGIWAPDISYHDGLFQVYATLRLNNPPEGVAGPLRRQILVRSERPEGPYSKPIYLDVDNIDPSLFVDDDGVRYMAISPGITLVRLSADGTKIAGEPVLAWAGTGLPCPEGPRVLKRAGWYYAVLAEGGTGYGHCVTVARSKKLLGPYEPCPFNPVLAQRDPGAAIQRCGHGQLVETAAGDWWMLYLCGRMNGGPFTTLGRETALDPVEWTDDGWFAVNSGAGPSAFQSAPDLPESPCPEAFRDDFDSPRLALNWEFVRNPDGAAWSLAERPGFFRIWTGDAGLDSIAAKNTLVRREKHHRYAASLRLEFHPGAGGEKAGLACYYGIRDFIALYVCGGGGRRVRLEENRNGSARVLGEVPVARDGAIILKAVTEGQTRSFLASAEGGPWMPVGRTEDASFLSDEGVLEGKHHTGTMVGLFANNGGSGARLAADFDWFEYSFGD